MTSALYTILPYDSMLASVPVRRMISNGVQRETFAVELMDIGVQHRLSTHWTNTALLDT